MSKSVFRLVHATARRLAAEAIRLAPDGWMVTVQEPTRNLEQNAAMWGKLADISQQVEWYGKHLTPEEWKAVFSASLKKQKVVQASTVVSWCAGRAQARWASGNSRICSN